MTQEGVEIQQRDQNSTAKEGHNSTKNPLNIHPGSVFNEGVKILSYTGKRQASLSSGNSYYENTQTNDCYIIYTDINLVVTDSFLASRDECPGS